MRDYLGDIMTCSYVDRTKVVYIYVVIYVLCFVLCRKKEMIWIRKDKGRKHRLFLSQCKEGHGLYLCDDDEIMVGNTGYCSGNVNKVLGCTYMMIWYNEKMVGDTSYCSKNVKNGHVLYLRNGFIIDMINTYMRSRPTSNMKKGWICRNLIWWIDATYWTRWGQWK